MSEIKEKKVIGRECKFVVHMPAKEHGDDDMHYVKERIHYDDGTTEPGSRIIKNFKRPYAITKRSKRNHQEKKEWEHVDNLDHFECTQSELRGHLAKRLDKGWGRETVRQLANSQYVYGTDISSTTLIKKTLYRDRWPDLLTSETVAVLDIETNMMEKNEEPIMTTVVVGEKVRIAILNKVVQGYADKEGRLQRAIQKYVHDFMDIRNKKSQQSQFYFDKVEKKAKDKIISSEDIDKLLEITSQGGDQDEAIRNYVATCKGGTEAELEAAAWDKDDIVELHNFQIEVKFVDTQFELFKFCFDLLHAEKPDFLAIWNMNFDLPRIFDALKNEGVDPRDIFCDPEVPRDRRVFRYKQDDPKRTTSSGAVKPKNASDQWHTLFLTASFYVVDAMCAYRYIRLGNQEESSYALDAILAKILKRKIQKLKFPQADGYSGPAWHEFMQRNYIFEYAAYNIFDCLAMIFLDEKTKDLRLTFHAASFISDFENFKSLPKRITDALYFDIRPDGWMLGDAGAGAPKVEPDPEESEDEDEEDDDDPYSMYSETLDLRNWILTLPAHLQTMGLNVILENPHLPTGIRAFVYDSDAVSAYPSCISVANVSKETTRREIIAIIGKEELLFRMQNLNLVLGGVNAIEYSTKMFDMDKPLEVLDKLLAGEI